MKLKKLKKEIERQTEAAQSINPYEQQEKFDAYNQQITMQRVGSLAGRSGSVAGNRSPFEVYDLYVERVFYLSESLILVLTRSLEFRLFYTQQFHHGLYDPKQVMFEAK